MVEADMVMHEVTDRLHASPAKRRVAEHLPRDLGEQIRLAVTATEQKHHAFIGQLLDCVLIAVRLGQFVHWRHLEYAARRERQRAGRRCETRA